MGAFKQRSIRPKQTKRTTPYEGDDIKDFVNRNKTYHTLSDAYKDVNYASWFEKDPEMSDMKLFIGEMLWFGIPIIAFSALLVCCILKAVGLW